MSLILLKSGDVINLDHIIWMQMFKGGYMVHLVDGHQLNIEDEDAANLCSIIKKGDKLSED